MAKKKTDNPLYFPIGELSNRARATLTGALEGSSARVEEHHGKLWLAGARHDFAVASDLCDYANRRLRRRRVRLRVSGRAYLRERHARRGGQPGAQAAVITPAPQPPHEG